MIESENGVRTIFQSAGIVLTAFPALAGVLATRADVGYGGPEHRSYPKPFLGGHAMRSPTMRSGLALWVLFVLAGMFVSCQSKPDESAPSEIKATAKQQGAEIKELNEAVKATAQQKELAEVTAAVAQLKADRAKSTAESVKTAAELAEMKAALAKVKTEWSEAREKWDADREEVARLRKAVALLIVSGKQPGSEEGPPQVRPPQGPPPRRLLPPTIDAEAAGAKAVEMFDADKDGKLSGAELDQCPGLKAAIAQVDPSGAKEVTAEKITARIKAWQASRLGRMSLSCTVTRNGKPLEGATVNFVPEKFLGENIQTATGRTDANGVAMVSIPLSGNPGDPPGVAPGLYHVEITKAGDDIPAKYNTKTTLGQEVAIDARGLAEGIAFKLDY